MTDKLRAGLFALLALFLALAQARAQTRPLRLCADPDDMPLSSNSGSEPGYYIELSRDIAGALGRPLDLVWTPRLFFRAGSKLRAGACDAIIGLPVGVGPIGPEMIVSQPILSVGYSLVVPPALAVTRLADLDGKRVAVQYASPAQGVLSRDSAITVVTAMTSEDGLQALRDGKVDAALLWGPSSSWLDRTQLHDQYKVIPTTGEHLRWNVVLAFASTQAPLRDAVDHALAGLGDRMQALKAKYALEDTAPVTLAAAQAPQPTAVQAAAPQQPAQRAAAAVPGKVVPAGADAQAVAEGHSLFNANCEHCHGPDAIQGLEPRNLRHLAKRHGDQMDAIFHYTVTHGRPSKGMPNWSGILTSAQFDDILAWLHTVQEP